MLGAFGKSTDAANNVANAAKFAFGENQSGGIFTAKAVMFGSTPQPTSTSIADKSSNPSLFSFIWLKLVRRRLLEVAGKFFDFFDRFFCCDFCTSLRASEIYKYFFLVYGCY